jgi:hypothetical protein
MVWIRGNHFAGLARGNWISVPIDEANRTEESIVKQDSAKHQCPVIGRTSARNSPSIHRLSKHSSNVLDFLLGELAEERERDRPFALRLGDRIAANIAAELLSVEGLEVNRREVVAAVNPLSRRPRRIPSRSRREKPSESRTTWESQLTRAPILDAGVTTPSTVRSASSYQRATASRRRMNSSIQDSCATPTAADISSMRVLKPSRTCGAQAASAALP